MTVPGGRGAARRTAVIVAGFTVLFFVADAALNWVLAVQRRHQAVAFDRVAVATLAAGRSAAPPAFRAHVAYQPRASFVPSPQHELGALVGQVGAETAAFFVLLAVVAVLARTGRSILSLLAVASAAVSIAADGGLLSRVTVPIRVTSPYAGQSLQPFQQPLVDATPAARAAWVRGMHLDLYYASPLWWRSILAVGVVLLLLAASLLLRRRTARVDAAERRRGYPVVALSLIAFGFVGMDGTPDVGLADNDRLYLGLLTSSLLLGLALVVAAASVPGRRGIAIAAGLSGALAIALLASRLATRAPGEAWQVYGFGGDGPNPPMIGTDMLWTALIAAAPLAWLVSEVLRHSHSTALARSPKPA